jgi:hypothetical protein
MEITAGVGNIATVQALVAIMENLKGCVFRLPPRRRWALHSSGTLRSVVVVKKSFLDFLALEDGTDRLSRNVGTELPLIAA